MLYLMFIPAIAMQILLIRQLIMMRRTDIAMFRFCAFNSEVTAFLASNEGQQLGHQEYLYARWLLEVSQSSVRQFHKVIKSRFSMSALLRSMRYVDNSLIAARMNEFPMGNKVLQDHYRIMMSNVEQAILMFNPLLKYKIALILLVLIGEGLTKIGVRKARLWTREMSDRWMHISNENEFCVHG